jgi:hypothetical protein
LVHSHRTRSPGPRRSSNGPPVSGNRRVAPAPANLRIQWSGRTGARASDLELCRATPPRYRIRRVRVARAVSSATASGSSRGRRGTRIPAASRAGWPSP